MRTTAWLLPVSLVALGASVPLSGCSSSKNHEERANTPEAQAKADPSHPEIATLPEQQAARKNECVGSCLPDPGSRPIDCGKTEAGFTYLWAWDLDNAVSVTDPPNSARATYVYDDNTTTFLVPEKDRWQPPGDVLDPSICGLNRAVRFKGGPFTEYGGGFGLSFVTSANPRGNFPLLLDSPEFPGDGIVESGAYDVREWEGIAIWVRRGPNGQATMRVGLTERSSAEDLNIGRIDPATGEVGHPEQEGQYCKRFRLCGCAPGTPCTPAPMGTDTICWDPALDDDPFLDDSGNVVKPTVCGEVRCDQQNPSLAVGEKDDLINGRSCSSAYTSDGLTNSFCYDPGVSPNPPAKRERCGNPFSRPITVGLDWQLLRVPFSELRQADEAYVADNMDLSSVKQLVFTHTTGWIDFWVGNVGFYRKP